MKPRLKGEAHEIRFADDAISCFEHKEDAEKVLSVLPKRFTKYGLTLHPEKTRLLEFGRDAMRNAKRQGKKPATFDFLGFTHICARSRKGKFTVHVKTMSKRLRRGLKAITEWCREHRHDPVNEQQKTLNAKLRGQPSRQHQKFQPIPLGVRERQEVPDIGHIPRLRQRPHQQREGSSAAEWRRGFDSSQSRSCTPHPAIRARSR